MVNYSAVIYKAFPDSTGVYGFKATWVGPNGIQRVSDNIPGTGDKWATAGNIVGILTGGGYVEASITYVTSISGVSAGWKFWYGYNGSGVYQSLTNAPPSKSLGLTLKKVGSSWHAIYNNWTDNESYDVTISGVPNQTLTTSSTTDKNALKHETAVNTNYCTYYNQFVDIDFNNVKYLDSSGNPTSQVPAANGKYVISALQSCLAVDESTEKIYHL